MANMMAAKVADLLERLGELRLDVAFMRAENVRRSAKWRRPRYGPKAFRGMEREVRRLNRELRDLGGE